MPHEQEGEPTETSPLLSKSAADAKNILEDPNGNVTTTTANDETEEGAVHGAEVERQVSRDGRSKQYEGLPDIRKRLKYMFPALAIGVFLSAADQTLIVSSYERIGSELDALNKTSWIATAFVRLP